MEIIFLVLERINIIDSLNIIEPFLNLSIDNDVESIFDNKFKITNETTIEYSETELLKYLDSLVKLFNDLNRELKFEIVCRNYGFYLHISENAGIYIDSKTNENHRKIINHLHKRYIENLYNSEILNII
jgi:intergrase/recombinase